MFKFYLYHVNVNVNVSSTLNSFFSFTFFIEVENFLLYLFYGNRRTLKLLHNWWIDKVKLFFILWKVWKNTFLQMANCKRNSGPASPSSGSKKSSKLISLMAHDIAICGNLDTQPESPLNQLREIIIDTRLKSAVEWQHFTTQQTTHKRLSTLETST